MYASYSVVSTCATGSHGGDAAVSGYYLCGAAGLLASSLYNFFACLLRALGNSTVPLVFLAVSSVLNIGLDLLFVVGFHWGIRGAAAATVVSQYIAGIGILLYVVVSQPGRAAGETMKP